MWKTLAEKDVQLRADRANPARFSDGKKRVIFLRVRYFLHEGAGASQALEIRFTTDFWLRPTYETSVKAPARPELYRADRSLRTRKGRMK